MIAIKYDRQIPLIVHFIVGQVDQKQINHSFPLVTNFSMINYLVILSARRQIRPKQLFVHYYEEPNSFWWTLTKQDAELDITLVKSRLVEHIFGHPVYHHSHRSDVLRTEILLEYGGIYLDTDVITLRSFDSLLNLANVVVGYENEETLDIGSAVILAKKNAPFVRRIYDSYQSYSDLCWNCHAVINPGRLAMMYTQELKVLPMNAFFLPYYSEREAFFERNDYNFTSNYACHLWNKVFNQELSSLTPDHIINGDFTLARMLRHAIGNQTLRKLDRLLKTNFIHHSKP